VQCASGRLISHHNTPHPDSSRVPYNRIRPITESYHQPSHLAYDRFPDTEVDAGEGARRPRPRPARPAQERKSGVVKRCLRQDVLKHRQFSPAPCATSCALRLGGRVSSALPSADGRLKTISVDLAVAPRVLLDASRSPAPREPLGGGARSTSSAVQLREFLV
jgi:hypothetical protein